MKQLKKIKEQLEEMAEREAMRLWRLARKAQKHGCSENDIKKTRDEAAWLHTTGQAYPERMLEDEFTYNFKYAFK